MAHFMAVTAYRNAGFGTESGAERTAEASGSGIDDPVLLRCLLDQLPTPTALVEEEGDCCCYANAAFRALGVVAGSIITDSF